MPMTMDKNLHGRDTFFLISRDLTVWPYYTLEAALVKPFSQMLQSTWQFFCSVVTFGTHFKWDIPMLCSVQQHKAQMWRKIFLLHNLSKNIRYFKIVRTHAAGGKTWFLDFCSYFGGLIAYDVKTWFVISAFTVISIQIIKLIRSVKVPSSPRVVDLPGSNQRL